MPPATRTPRNVRNASNLAPAPSPPPPPGSTFMSTSDAILASQSAADGESVCREVIEGVVRDACVVAINRVLDNLARPYAVQSLCNELLDCITATFISRDSGAIRPSGWSHIDERDAPKRIAIDSDARATMETTYRASTPSAASSAPSPVGRPRNRSFSGGKLPFASPLVSSSSSAAAFRGRGDEDSSSRSAVVRTSSKSAESSVRGGSSNRIPPHQGITSNSSTNNSVANASLKSTTTSTGGGGGTSTYNRGGSSTRGSNNRDVVDALPKDVAPPYAKYLPSPDTVDQEEVDFAVARYAEDRRKDSITEKHAHLSKQLQGVVGGLWGGGGAGQSPTVNTPQQRALDQPPPPTTSNANTLLSAPASPLARTPNSPSRTGGWSNNNNTYKNTGADVIIDGAAGRVIKVTKIGSLRDGGGGGGTRSPDGVRSGTGVGYAVADKAPTHHKKGGGGKKAPTNTTGTNHANRRVSIGSEGGETASAAASEKDKTATTKAGRLSPLGGGGTSSARRGGGKSGTRQDRAGRDQAFFVPDPSDNPNRMQVSLSAVKGVNASGDSAAIRIRNTTNGSIMSGSTTPHSSLTPRKGGGGGPLQATYPLPNNEGPRSAPSTVLNSPDSLSGLPQGWGGGTARAAVMEARKMAR